MITVSGLAAKLHSRLQQGHNPFAGVDHHLWPQVWFLTDKFGRFVGEASSMLSDDDSGSGSGSAGPVGRGLPLYVGQLANMATFNVPFLFAFYMNVPVNLTFSFMNREGNRKRERRQGGRQQMKLELSDEERELVCEVYWMDYWLLMADEIPGEHCLRGVERGIKQYLIETDTDTDMNHYIVFDQRILHI